MSIEFFIGCVIVCIGDVLFLVGFCPSIIDQIFFVYQLYFDYSRKGRNLSW